MPHPVSFTPPARDLNSEPSRPVRRRHVLFVPGYDPEAEGRYRMLLVRELLRYAKRFGFSERGITPVEKRSDPPSLAWTVTAARDEWRTETKFELLRWDDIVERDFKRSLPVAILALFGGVLYSIASGGMTKFWRLSWKFGGVIIYPPIMVLVSLAVSLGVGTLLQKLLWALFPLPPILEWPVILATAFATFRATYPLGEKWFVWHLMHDWVFNWQHGTGFRPDYEERVDAFASRLVAVAALAEADEVLVVGHSSGAVMAMEVMARALEQDRMLGERGAAVSLLTLGSCLPLVAINPRAHRCRDGIARIVGSPSVLWVEYQAPQDWLNFAGFNPIRDLGLGGAPETLFNPVVRSARFKDIVEPKTYDSMRFKPFRMHFQFLMSNDRAGEYDYIMIIVGPLTLSERVRAATSPPEV